jgi:hypothetical protein
MASCQVRVATPLSLPAGYAFGDIEGGKLPLAIARCARGDKAARRLFERSEETICDRRKLTGMTIGDYAAGFLKILKDRVGISARQMPPNQILNYDTMDKRVRDRFGNSGPATPAVD